MSLMLAGMARAAGASLELRQYLSSNERSNRAHGQRLENQSGNRRSLSDRRAHGDQVDAQEDSARIYSL
jgi:hypothetical protein